ncbi:C-type lectin domain family 4 member F-like [Neocloeon triangulifer]|uniref:C-type lectin domain family 4 member F-like n=1 Tax=Neocloeon triangulifer TaxID=2078957 RepID=UPI00286F6100|nr:C-type lectin domain family 4 member F-like [Neocloeon triangulifer]
MARFVLLLAGLIALASISTTEAQESEQLKIFNEMNQKLNQLTKLVHDQVEVSNQRQKQLEDIQKALRCVGARVGGLTLLSNGKSYSFHQAGKSWSSANETCVKQGLHLATIRDREELLLVLEEANKVDRYTENWWVSAKNAATGSEQDFRWQDGTQLESNSTLWGNGDHENEDCVRIHYYFSSYDAKSYTSGKLFRHPCTETSYYICELPSEC